MASRTANPRDASRNRSRDTSRTRVRDRSVEPHQQRRNIDSTPKAAGTKRLFSNRASRLPIDSSEDHGENYGGDAQEDEEVHSEKRHRTSDWPLSNTSPASTTAPTRQPLRSRRNATNSPSVRRRSSSQARPSKFLEGSMNDRASMKPPMPYIGTDQQQHIDEFDDHRQNNDHRWSKTRKYQHHANPSMAESATDRSETSRHSGIFRFGKSIASTFNPSNWRIWSKPQPPVVDEEELAHQRVLRERQEAAERIYQELKHTGHFQPAATPRARAPRFQEYEHEHEHEQEPEMEMEMEQEPEHEFESQKSSAGKHDSGVDFYDQSAYPSVDISRDERRESSVYLEPPRFSGANHRGTSPAASFSGSVPSLTPSKSSFNLKRASFSNIKKAFTNDSTTSLHETEFRSARRIPSRKDLHKQQKLVKRVSDLEGKLQAARRQLTESLAQPVPSQPQQNQQPQQPARVGRPKFVPGALSTLPSERLLSGYVNPEADDSENEAFHDIGRAVTVDHPKKDARVTPGRRADSERRESSQLPRKGIAGLNAKPLPCPPQDEVLQSVEADDIPEGKGNLAVAELEEKPIKVEEDETSDLSSLEERDEITLLPVAAAATKKKHPTPKKRKSVFEGSADDGGKYKPTDGDSDGESEIKKPTIKKRNNTTTRPRKLHKVTTTTTVTEETTTPVVAQVNKPPIPTVSPRRSTATTIRASSRLVKPNLRTSSSRQSASPPPSSTFTGLDYGKPSTSSKARKNSEQLASPAKTAAYIANPAMGNDVPPMPKLPNSVRLASGEVVRTQPASVSVVAPVSKINGNENGASPRKLKKEKPKVECESVKEFEWPADVF